MNSKLEYTAALKAPITFDTIFWLTCAGVSRLRSSQPHFEKHGQASRTFFVARLIVHLRYGAESGLMALFHCMVRHGTVRYGSLLGVFHWVLYLVPGTFLVPPQPRFQASRTVTKT